MIPPTAPAVAIMRHAERGEIPPGALGNEILLTKKGKQDALKAGQMMKKRISCILHSPVERCRETAQTLQTGSGSPRVENCLGLRCDVYLEDFQTAQKVLGRLTTPGNYEPFLQHMASAGAEVPYPGFKSPIEGTVDMVHHLLHASDQGIAVGVTHDWLVDVAVVCATGFTDGLANRIDYLDALFIWEDRRAFKFYFKGETGGCLSSFSGLLAN